MSVRSFLDTNIFLYADDRSARRKQQRAIELFEQHRQGRSGVVSTQVLQEYFSTATRKFGVDPERARETVVLMTRLDVVVLEPADVLAGIDLCRLHGFSFWDSLIVQAAKQAGCSVILSEDMQHSRRIDGIEIVNPFH